MFMLAPHSREVASSRHKTSEPTTLSCSCCLGDCGASIRKFLNKNINTKVKISIRIKIIICKNTLYILIIIFHCCFIRPWLFSIH